VQEANEAEGDGDVLHFLVRVHIREGVDDLLKVLFALHDLHFLPRLDLRDSQLLPDVLLELLHIHFLGGLGVIDLNLLDEFWLSEQVIANVSRDGLVWLVVTAARKKTK